ncbi:PEP-CTERM sorting domain-containing protein [Nostoc sp.]|uniref:PEP-CTERM sorting domain-containing protein n=1 Tax=Nostoc sp. TaxID=1180 RepID=UPI002FFBEC83
MKNLAVLSATALAITSGLVFGRMQAASALSWDWNSSGTGIAANGTFTTNDTPNNSGFDAITGIIGTQNGETITGLQPTGTAIPGNEPFNVDNLISFDTPQLTDNGFGYSTLGGKYYNTYFTSSLPTPGYFEVASNFTLQDTELPITFSATIITIPEPTSILSLLVLGTVGAHLALKRNKLSKFTQKKLEQVVLKHNFATEFSGD